MKNVRRSPLTALAVGVVAVIGLGACTSNPSAKAVAIDVVESMDGLTADQRACMLTKLDEDYSEDELKEIGETNETVDFSVPGAVDTQGTEALQKFVADLNSCMTEG